MSRRVHSSAVAAAVTVALLAGCGGSSGSKTTSSTTTAAAKTSQSTSSAPAALSSTSTRTTPSVPANVGSIGGGSAAVYCESALAAAKNLSATEKSQLKGFCASLAHAPPAQLKSAEKTICNDIINTVPASEQALAKAECAKL